MSSSSASSRRSGPSERGVSVVEYALGLALVIAVVLVGVQYLQEESAEEFDDRQALVSDPGEVGGVPPTNPPLTIPPSTAPSTTTSTSVASTTTSAPTSTSVPPSSTSTTVPWSGSINPPTCPQGTSSSTCSFVLSSPTTGYGTPTWAVTAGPTPRPVPNPTTGNTTTIGFDKPGTYTVQVTVGSRTETRQVTCTQTTGQNRTFSCA